jgi:quinol monooxygenase YgiN
MEDTEIPHPVITVLEARLVREQWGRLERAYAEATRQLPPQMLETFLVQSAADPELWRVMSVWRSREALEAYRSSVDTPRGVLVFRAAGAEPSLGLLEVVANVRVGEAPKPPAP